MTAGTGKSGLSDEARDSLLLQRASEGDEEAVEQLLEAYKPLVLSRASSYFIRGGDRDDLIQEAMIGLYRAIRFCPPQRRESFSSYAWQAVDNRLLDAVRTDHTRNNQMMHDSLSLERPLPSRGAEDGGQEQVLGDTISSDAVADPEEQALINEDLKQLLCFIEEKLTLTEKNVLIAFSKGSRYKEIAAQEGMSEKGVDSALQRARKKLKEYRRRIEDGQQDE